MSWLSVVGENTLSYILINQNSSRSQLFVFLLGYCI